MTILDLLKNVNYTPIPKEKIKKTGKIPVYSQSKNKIEGYINETENSINGPAILFGDHTSEITFIPNTFVATANCKILKKFENNCDIYFIYTFLSYKIKKEYTSDYGRHFKLLKEIKIPKFNISFQEKIGSFFKELDELIIINENFKNIINKIEKYIFNEIKKTSFSKETIKLKDLAIYINGKAHEKNITNDGTITLINSKFISSNGKIKKYVNKNHQPTKKNDICLVLSDVPNGKALGKTYIAKGDEALNQRICILRTEKYDPIVLSFFVNRNKEILLLNDGVSQTNLKKDDVINIKIPNLNEKEQENIKKIYLLFKEYIELIDNKIISLEKIKKYYLNKIF